MSTVKSITLAVAALLTVGFVVVLLLPGVVLHPAEMAALTAAVLAGWLVAITR